MLTHTVLACAATLGGCAATIGNASPPPGARIAPELMCRLQSDKVSESSGVETSTLKDGVYWTHNDSGDTAAFYAFDANGSDLGRFVLTGAKAFDWEDMSSAHLDGVSYLYFADVGDNAKNRPNVVVYRVQEPAAKAGDHAVDKYEAYTLKYPDGSHDCEAMFVTPAGDIQLITKSPDGKSGVYAVTKPKATGMYMLKKLGELKFESAIQGFRMVTGADMKGDKVVIRTYPLGYVYSGNASNWFKSEAQEVKIALEGQGEAICFDFDDNFLITTSEGAPCPVSKATR